MLFQGEDYIVFTCSYYAVYIISMIKIFFKKIKSSHFNPIWVPGSVIRNPVFSLDFCQCLVSMCFLFYCVSLLSVCIMFSSSYHVSLVRSNSAVFLPDHPLYLSPQFFSFRHRLFSECVSSSVTFRPVVHVHFSQFC